MTLWGSRFAESPDAPIWDFTASTADRRLLADDVAGSVAHVAMLGEVGLLTPAEAVALDAGLRAMADEAAAGEFLFTDDDEDVHTAVERRLTELAGPVGAKVHTGRSRNDQVALDLRLYLSRGAKARVRQIRELATALVDQAEAAGDRVVAAYTHLQQSQAVPLGHYLLAHVWPLLRDVDRFEDAAVRVDISPLGAGAGGGSSLPIDPSAVATELELPAVFGNSLDAVAARDFVSEYSFCCAQALVNCSRLAEELVLWATSEFGWVTFADRHSTGSSALPHKKNPDAAELTRGKAAASIGSVAGLLALQKGLPLSYNRDLQEDKALVFAADDALGGALPALTAMVKGAEFHPPPPSSWVTMLDLAEVLVERGVAFRQAHDAVGRLAGQLAAAGLEPADLTVEDLTSSHGEFVADDLRLVDPATSVKRRRSPGGGSFQSLASQLVELRERLATPESPTRRAW
ncbi:MAG: argininosuccinate lyase [Acidimicrobiia bacterium]